MQEGDAAAHGLHRWQQGFDLSEVTRELGWLNECVVAELEEYAAARPALAPAAMTAARLIWSRQFGAANGASTAQFFRLQKMEASSHIQDLEDALSSLRELEQERALIWQQAAHDLRGNLGVVANATAVLAAPGATDDMRGRFLRLLDRNVSALHHLLDDVTSLARLQAGHESRHAEAFDAALLLQELCDGLGPLAQQRGLYLRCDGPAPLQVEGDSVKTRRIAQNLVLNAIKYTEEGGISVTWGDSPGENARRWFMQVQDTGPGFHAGPGAQIAGALETATDHAKQIAAAGDHGVSHAADARDASQRSDRDSRRVHQAPGEGIGLSIVKRLCDLLDATIEVESVIAVGTIFRILLPQK